MFNRTALALLWTISISLLEHDFYIDTAFENKMFIFRIFVWSIYSHLKKNTKVKLLVRLAIASIQFYWFIINLFQFWQQLLVQYRALILSLNRRLDPTTIGLHKMNQDAETLKNVQTENVILKLLCVNDYKNAFSVVIHSGSNRYLFVDFDVDHLWKWELYRWCCVVGMMLYLRSTVIAYTFI